MIMFIIEAIVMGTIISVIIEKLLSIVGTIIDCITDN